MSDFHRWDGTTLTLSIRVQPKASRDEIVGPYGDSLKIRITAPPVDGKANAHLIKYLAKLFGVPRASISLLSGSSGRDKRLRIESPARYPDVIPPP